MGFSRECDHWHVISLRNDFVVHEFICDVIAIFCRKVTLLHFQIADVTIIVF